MVPSEPLTAVKVTPLNLTLLTVRAEALVSSEEMPTTKIRSAPDPIECDHVSAVAAVPEAKLA